MNRLVLLIAGGALAASAGRAAAGTPPAWCADHTFSGDPTLRNLTSSDPEQVMETFAHAMCAPSEEVEANRASIEKGRQAWAKRFGMVEADWADVVAWYRQRGPQAQLSTKDPTRFTPVDQYIAIVEGFDRPGGQGPLREPIYAADAFGANLSQVGRFGYLSRCIASGTHPADWAICQGDIAAFDLAAFHDELHRDTAHDGAYKMVLRFAAFTFKAALKQHAADVERAVRDEPAYAKMFEVATAARAEWDATLAKETDLLALVQRVEAGHFAQSRSMLAGCEATTAAALATQVGKLPAKAFANMLDQRMDPTKGVAATAGPVLMSNPGVNLAAIAYTLCNHDGTANFLAWFLQQTPGNRGPRTLAFTRLLSEKIQLDDLNARIDWPGFDRPYDRSGGGPISSGGVIASTKADGNLITVKFARLLVKVDECVESHQTGRVYKIHPDGRVEYEQVCDRMGTVTHDDQWMDFSVAKKYQPQLKKGARISVLPPTQDARDAGSEVFVTWPSGKATTPNWMLGATLK